MSHSHEYFMKRAIELAEKATEENLGGPFGAVVVKDDEIIAEGVNNVTSSDDPTAHAEITAIRNACKKLGSFQLEDCVLYTSCEPCPMCFGAIYWARPKKVFFACDQEDAAAIDFDDQFIYDELDKDLYERKIEFTQIMRDDALEAFRRWDEKTDKIEY